MVLDKRKAWKWFAAVGGTLVLLVALAPYLASLGLFRDSLLRLVMPPIHGSVHCGGASLGWFSPIRFDNIEIRSTDDEPVVVVDRLEGDRPLWRMLANHRNLGRFRIHQPQVDVVLSERGANLSEVFVGMRRDKKRPPHKPPDVSLGIELIDGSVSFRGLGSPRSWTAGPINLAFALEPSSATADGRPQLTVEPGTVSPRTAVTPEACRDLLKYIAPILADVTTVRGDFAIQLDRWRLPLAEPAAGEGSGQLMIWSLDVAPGPLVAQLAAILKLPTKLLEVQDTPVKFHMADGRIYHDEIVFRIEGVTVRTHGSVGVDGSLDLVAEVPMPEKLLGEGPVAAALAKQTLTIPIGGTLSKPKLDAAKLGEAGMDLLSGVLGELLQGKKVDLSTVLKAMQERRQRAAKQAEKSDEKPSGGQSTPVLNLLRDTLGEETPLLDRLRQRRQDRNAPKNDKKTPSTTPDETSTRPNASFQYELAAMAGKSDDSPPRSLADLLEPADAVARNMPELPRMKVDDARAAALGIRKLSGKHLDLYTDLPAGPEIDSLPAAFDQAFPQWCEYFHVDPAKNADWRLTGFLIHERPRFKRAGLLPDDLPPFQHAFSRNFDFWVYEQPSDYYRRHLVLHEGVHCFMNTLLGACGPPWYMEGIAELLATHRWQDGRLQTGYVPAAKEETPMWGRIKIIKDAVAAGRTRRLEDVLAYDSRAHFETEPYAWCWAAALLLDRHPRYQARFRRLYEDVLRPNFNERFRKALGDDWPRLAEEWEVFVANLEYGDDVVRGALDFTPGNPLPPDGATVEVAADRGWQNSGVRLERGVAYRLRAEGRYQVADRPQVWWCEPGGVTMRYYQGRPLGVLLAAVHPSGAAGQASSGTQAGSTSPLVRPSVVGLETVLTPEVSGTLYLKINDSAGEWGDNAGKLSVRIAGIAPGPIDDRPRFANNKGLGSMG